MRRVNYNMLARALGFKGWDELTEDFIAQWSDPAERQIQEMRERLDAQRSAEFRALAEATKRHVPKRSNRKRRRK